MFTPGEPLSVPDAERISDNLSPSTGKYYNKLRGMYGFGGMILFRFDPVCGSAVLRNAEQTAKSLDALARENRAVGRIVEFMLQSSTMGLFLGAHAEMVGTIVAHHMPQSVKDNIANMVRLPFMVPAEEVNPEANGSRVN